jgi:hypothetical protein
MSVIQVASILPPKCLYSDFDADINRGKIRMALAHQVKNPRVAHHWRMMRKHGYYVIMDNGVVETGQALPMEELLQLWFEGVCDEIVLPDVFDDHGGTLEAHTEALKELDSWGYCNPRPKIMAVIHAKTLEEFKSAYNSWVTDARIDVIGLPKVLTNNFLNNRAYLAKLTNMPPYIGQPKPFHLLGIWHNPLELHQFRMGEPIPWVRSVDSNFAAAAAWQGDYVKPDKGLLKPGVSSEQFEAIDITEFRELLPLYKANLYNIEWFAGYVR